MDWTLVGDLELLDALLLREVSLQGDLALDAIEHALSGFTFGAVFGVDPRVAQAHRHAGERPLFPSRIQRDGHGRSGAERSQEQFIGSRPSVGSTGGDRLVGDQAVAPRRDLLDESLRAAAHHHQTLLHVDHDATSGSCVKVRISAAPRDVRLSATPSNHLPAPAPSPTPLAAALASPGRLSLHPVTYSN